MRDFDRYSIPGEEQVASFLRKMAFAIDRRMNPVFEGHRTTYPGQANLGMKDAIGFGLMYTTPYAVYAVVGHQLLKTPGQTVGIETSPQGSYHLGGTGEVYYPFKGIVDRIF